MTLPNLLDGVAEFMRLAEQQTGEWLDPKYKDVTYSGGLPMSEDGFNALRAFRIEILREEFQEYLDKGEDRDDPVEILDGLLDIIVVAYGTALTYFDREVVEEAAAEVTRSNLSKVDGSLGDVIKRADGKVLKPEGWTPPNIAGVLGIAND